MRARFVGFRALLAPSVAVAETARFSLSITGDEFAVEKSLELSDLGEGKTAEGFDFTDKSGHSYSFNLAYKPLPKNRSYPGNLDVTLSDGGGKKLGYLFFATDGVGSLEKIGTFGMVVDVEGKPVDLRFVFRPDAKGAISVRDLDQERFVQDTLASKFDFQMIRPVVAPLVEPGKSSISYDLDSHPYQVNYTLADLPKGGVEFQFNLTRTGESGRLLERIYYHADSLATLRSAMFAGKYFDAADGAFKLVFYPALGLTDPNSPAP